MSSRSASDFACGRMTVCLTTISSAGPDLPVHHPPPVSPFDYPDRAHAGHFSRQPGAMHHLNHQVDVLVGLGLLLGQALPALCPGHDAALAQPLIDAPSLRAAHSSGAAEHASRAM